MKLALYIAKRYLFSKKSHNAINIISMISVCGIAIASIVLVCMLSVFNGFTSVVAKTFNAFDPDLEISPVQGKVFNPNTDAFFQVKALAEIELSSETLEENALLKFENRQEPIVLRGVSPEFKDLANIESLLLDGEYALREGDTDFAIMGAGLAAMMGTRAGFLSPLEIYMPKRSARINIANPVSSFSRSDAYVSSVFALNQAEYDEQMLIVSIEMARELLNYEEEVSTLSIKAKQGVDVESLKKKISGILGDEYIVKNRMEQQANIFQWVNMEKWIAFFILAITSMIAIFNVVGSLSMLIIEKEEDIQILKSMGARNNLITKIFMFEGWLITFFGSLVGLILGITICLVQEHFEIIKIGEAGTFVVDAYPVDTQLSDIAIIFVTISLIGFFAVLYPCLNLKKNLDKA